MTRKSLVVLAAMALLVPASRAQPDDISGRIALIDHHEHTITLTSGMTFLVAEEISIQTLKPGEDIKITFSKVNGMLIAVKLTRSDGNA